MNIKCILVIAIALCSIVAAQASPRTSANYTIATDTADAGGRRTTSASYTNDGSAGGIAGLSTVAVPAETAKHGYIGQLFDVTGLTLTAVSLNVNEGATDQLAAWQLLDDATFLAVPAASVAWSVAAGPIAFINTNGLAFVGVVYQNTAATAQGSYLGNTGTLALTVLNVNLDNFGAYAGDTLDDAWQVQYFGLPPNALAGPLVDPDGDGQNNAFEFTAGLIPNNPASRFTLTVQPVAGQPTQKKLLFAPLALGRTYTVKFKTDLTAGTWTTLPGATFTDNGLERTVTDPSATEPRKFYQVEITKP